MDVNTLHKLAVRFMDSLEKEMPGKHANTGLSVHNTTKVHSALHLAIMLILAGNSANYSTNPCELAHKHIVKRKQRLTNKKRMYMGLSLLRTNRRATVARMMCQAMAGILLCFAVFIGILYVNHRVVLR